MKYHSSEKTAKMEVKENLAAFLVKGFDQSNTKTLDPVQKACQFEDQLRREIAVKSATNPRPHQEYCQVMDVETILVEDLIKPLTLLMKYFLPFQNLIEYDPVAKRVVAVNGSLIRKVICILWELLVFYKLGSKFISNLTMGGDSPADSAISTGAYFIFILFNLSCFHFYWWRTKNCCAIFNHALSLAENIHLKERSPPRIQIIRCSAHASWIFSTLYVISTLGLYVVQLCTFVEMSRMDNGTVLNSSRELGISRKIVKKFDAIEISGEEYNIVLQVFSTIASFLNISYWMMSFLQFGVWGLFFRQLLKLLYWRIETIRGLGQFIVFPTEIRTFNKIGSIMEEYNSICGIPNIMGAVVCVAYVSTSAKHAFSDFLSIFQIGAGPHLLLSYIPLTVAAIWLAEVQRVAGSFADILKEEYGRFNKECGDPAESLCGIAIVHYDLSTSNVGLKGLGFYTVSYQFITTLVSVIITYSILVYQFSPQEKSVEP